MRRDDISFAVHLTNQEGWDVPRRDFERILRLDPRGSFVATEYGHRVGITTTTCYGRRIAWIGNVIVRKQDRHRHVGQQLVQHAVAYLIEKRVKHIALYCFKHNVPFYTRLGFVRGPRFARLRRESQRPSARAPKSPETSRLTLSRLLSIDRKAFGADRERLFKLLLNASYAWYLGYSAGSSSSFLIVKKYDDMYELGPWVSFGLGRSELNSLLLMSLRTARGKPIEVSCPLPNRRAIEVVRSRGFHLVNDGRLMFYERKVKLGQPEAIVAYGFLDKG